MILENAKPRLLEAINDCKKTNTPKEVKFIYNELLTYDKIYSVFEYLFSLNIDFSTRNEEYRYVIIINKVN